MLDAGHHPVERLHLALEPLCLGRQCLALNGFGLDAGQLPLRAVTQPAELLDIAGNVPQPGNDLQRQ